MKTPSALVLCTRAFHSKLMVLLQVRDALAITPPLKLVTSVTGIAVVSHPLGKQTAERFTRWVSTAYSRISVFQLCPGKLELRFRR